jgi:hypothetical protein
MRITMGGRRLAISAGLAMLAVLAIFWIRGSTLQRATASPPQPPAQTESASLPAAPPTSPEYSQRVVAYIYDSIAITREDLGEYLIARMGAERLNNLVNRRIIEKACREKGIEVTEAEVEAELATMIKPLGVVTLKDFEEKILKPRKTTLYEWKEDSVRPSLMMKKLCRDRVQVTDDDLHKAFQAWYGDKVECRIILWPKSEKKVALAAYGKIRDSEEEFDRAARSQASARLASSAGHIEPIGHNTTGNEALEKAAFSLRPGELSEVIETPEGYVVLKCVSRVPPNTSISFEATRDALAKEVAEKKLQQEIPKAFAELREKARPKQLLGQPLTEAELTRAVNELLQPDKKAAALPRAPGN